MKIALIEDEPECFETFSTLLEDHSHEVKTFIEADEVIEHINEIVKSDLVILDLMIQLGTVIDPNEGPETGIAIYKRLRKLSEKLKIVVLTARSKSDVWDFFANDPLVRFIAKPTSDIDGFYSTIESWK